MDSNLPNNKNDNAASAPVSLVPEVASQVKRKTSKTPVLFATLFGVLAVAGIGFGVFEYMELNKKNDEIKSLKADIASIKDSIGDKKDTKPDDRKKNNDENIFETADAEVREAVAKFKEVAESIVGVAATETSEYIATTKFDSLKTATDLEKGYGFVYSSSDIDLRNTTTIKEAIIDSLEENGYEEFADAATHLDGDTYINKETGVVCLGDGLPFTLVCGYYKWVSDETIELVNDLADAYKEKEGKYPHYLGVYADDDYRITDSEISPYQKLMAKFENAAALFYRTSETADWKYFTGTQAVLSCSDYNTKELKNAYSGEVCYDEDAGKNSTVQP